MPRMQPFTPAGTPGDAAAGAPGSAPATSAGILARCPDILEASRALGAAPGKSGLLPAEIRSLVCLRAAQIVTCPF
ncbi:MAG: hypothetical protein WD470_08030 [Rhodospirillaceae bacterium]